MCVCVGGGGGGGGMGEMCVNANSGWQRWDGGMDEWRACTYVAVPGRNRTLFHCAIRPCYRVRSTVAQNFH